MTILEEPLHFEWDAGNRDKNWVKHHVTNAECEEVFSDPHKRLLPVVSQARGEERYLIIGQTKQHRRLFIVFTIRKHAVRVISARDVHRKERILYEKAT